VLERTSQGKGKADLWTLSTWANERWKATVPAMSGGESSADRAAYDGAVLSRQDLQSDIAGTVHGCPDGDDAPALTDADEP
jgi:hypothetical protein